ncbi:NAD-dependent epimerase/dehydratase family protein [Aquimarina sp. AD1]|uniref:sugar nucleotide-binding protein n=1 Tax=Aquimarina sp. (strain AD1) TaxID=1714848 RepID=UPI000E47E009|nr:sugar nucleotide-binding protein [Aquimarina sp. AD1]AXT55411.1 NAD-dependent epimerase/dehydratase family protein [Aquimarina sp. AD1]RKN04798.1 NAD-dependent epimerase/dehydratase family protein [Aquimarina sp. AD1]
MKKILIIGASGFIGNALYKELNSYFDTYGTYHTDNPFYEKNQKFFQYDMELEDISILLDNLKPTIIVSAIRGNFNSQVDAHHRIIDWIKKNKSKLIFLSSANVFDTFSNYPSYEYDKTLSESVFGRFKIKIENALMRLPTHKYVIARIPMIFGASTPRVQELRTLYDLKALIEVFPNVIINATSISKLTQQLHYIINRSKKGIFHLGSTDLIYHLDLIKEICDMLQFEDPIFKQVFDSNNDRYLAVLPKDNLLPKNLQITTKEVIDSIILK